MLKCQNCKNEIENDSTFCRFCGKKLKAAEPLQKSRGKKTRGNGQGSVFRHNGKWKAEVTLSYKLTEDGKLKRVSRSKYCDTKKEALAAIADLKNKIEPINMNPTLSELYQEWLQLHSRKVGKSTMDCYKAAYKYLAKLHYAKFSELRTEHWQNIIDECPCGIRTKQNMKALATLLYKFAIQKDVVNKDYASFAYIDIVKVKERQHFTGEMIETLFSASSYSVGARYILCLCYTGFRLEEFLELRRESYNAELHFFIGGSKTKAGRERTVTISPKIQPFVDSFLKDGYIFSPDGKKLSQKHFREKIFYPTLEELGIIPKGEKTHTLTPHCCRHTFATLMKNVEAPAVDKQRLIGHSSEEMLKNYTHSNIIDLMKITNAI